MISIKQNNNKLINVYVYTYTYLRTRGWYYTSLLRNVHVHM